jgi:hypothetical protein
MSLLPSVSANLTITTTRQAEGDPEVSTVEGRAAASRLSGLRAAVSAISYG